MKRLLPLLLMLLSTLASAERTGPLSLAATYPTKLASQAHLNLLVIPLPAGTIDGMDVGYAPNDIWTGNAERVPNTWAPQGYDGVHFVGEGIGKTIIDGKDGDGSVMIQSVSGLGIETGIVKFSQCTIRPNNSKAIFAGTDTANRPTKHRLSLILEDFWLDADVGRGGRWGIFANACDVLFLRGTLRGAGLSEHQSYFHQAALHGWTFLGCDFEGAYAELLKITARPSAFGGPHVDGSWYRDPAKLARAKHSRTDGYQPIGTPGYRPNLLVKWCIFRRWGLGGQGGGIVCQGTGADITVTQCEFWQNNGFNRGLAIAVDDSGVEHYTLLQLPDGSWTWVAGEPPANGNVLIEGCLIVGEPGPSWLSPLVSVISLRMNNTEAVARSFRMRACAMYGANRTLTVNQVPQVSLIAINKNPIPHYAQSRGIDTRVEPLTHIQGRALQPVSVDYVGAAR